ncbi:MAG: response regulator transcription factor [Oscillospiraceae bacterium]|jgi:DNA-binding response OmpR family regulator|nr:response regulator transcription factor [Oscillospiraceae bacterium]
MKILIIEDDITIRSELKSLLERYNYQVIAAESFENLPQTAADAAPDLILLDLGLPLRDGYYVCREIRKSSGVPIIVVTSRNTEIDELTSMNLGADDFITKPYNTQILLARIENVLRRAYGALSENTIQYGGAVLNLSDSTIIANGKTLELTKNETRVLRLLMTEQGKIISRNQIMEELWQTDEFVDDNTLTVNINRLRKKLSETGLTDFIRTKRGQGYII